MKVNEVDGQQQQKHNHITGALNSRSIHHKTPEHVDANSDSNRECHEKEIQFGQKCNKPTGT